MSDEWISKIVGGLSFTSRAESPLPHVRAMLARVRDLDPETVDVADALWARTMYSHSTPTAEEWGAAAERLRPIVEARKRVEGAAGTTAEAAALEAYANHASFNDEWCAKAESARVAHRRAQTMLAAADMALQATEAGAGDLHAYTRLGWAGQRAAGASAAAAHKAVPFKGDQDVYDAAVLAFQHDVVLALVA